MVSIQPIDKNSVNQICSGQVILNLATTVKELLENSIDAGADSIQIKLGEYGSDFIEVIDNGCGIEEINYQALTLKHYTSKIKNFHDITNIETFGFRGEALSSLCALSNVTITTQHKNSCMGSMLKFDHRGIITSNIKTFRKVGTSVRIENLFCTLPVRRTEFLKNLKKEFSKMCNVLYAYCIQSTGIRITCTNQTAKTKVITKGYEEQMKRSTCTTVIDTKGESLENNIVSVFGMKQKQNLLKITEVTPSEETLKEFGLEHQILDLNKFKLEGFISSCAHGCGRATSDRQFYYINSRPVDNNKVSKLVNEIYHQYNNRQDPFVILNVKICNGSFDLNVTPDKRHILLQHETLLLAFIKESLHSVFRKIPSTLEVQNVSIKNSIHGKWDKPIEIENFKNYFTTLMVKKGKKQIESFSDGVKETYPQVSCDVQRIEINKPKSSSLRELEKSKSESDITYEVHVIEKKNETVFHLNTLDHIGKQSDSGKEFDTAEPTTTYNKRKLLECPIQKIQVPEVQENSCKRVKYDIGLNEDEKKERKKVHCNINLFEVKRERLKKSKARKETVNKINFSAQIKESNNERAEKELQREITKDNFKEMEIVGQFNLGFIITKLNSDIFIIDQHASDEKYNFETLKSTTVIQSQKLFNPERLELTVDREELMLQHREIFKKNGFDFTFDNNEPPTKRISLTAIPFSKSTLFGKEDVDELLFFLEESPEWKILRPSRVNSMFASRACRKSVMIGTPLNHQEMRKIVDHMGEIEQPWNCPHGRPTMRHLINFDIVSSEVMKTLPEA